jgi:hypothetical protein
MSATTAQTGFWSADKISSALRWWEPARVLYNLLLLAFFFLWSDHPVHSLGNVKIIAVLIILAGCANLLYCVAYPVDVFVQNSGYSGLWRRFGRPVLFLTGLAVALAIEFLVMAL